MTWQPAAYQPGRVKSWPGFQGDRMTKREITILNIHTGVVGLPGYKVFLPGEKTTLLVDDTELKAWEDCQFVQILVAGAPLPDCVKISEVSTGPDNSGRMQPNNALGAAPGTRRAGRPRKVEPVNPGQPGPEGTGGILAEVHQQPGQPAFPGTTENLTDDQAEAWPLDNAGQGGQFDGGGATETWQDEPLPDFKSLAAGDD